MNVLIVGYGTMGREIEKILVERDHSIAARIDPINQGADAKSLTHKIAEKADTAIEFSLPAGVFDNAALYAQTGIRAVVGTTGWHERVPEVKTFFKDRGSFIYGSNFSIGAHLFFDLVEKAAAAVSDLPQYDIMMYEIHHKNKKDSPSGTALETADRILKAHETKSKIVTARLDRRPEPDELHVASIRGGGEPGQHKVIMDSAADIIEISHQARSRAGLALGAVLAAEWLQSRDGFFTVEDFLDDIMTKGDTV
jgi:4-hydroxy-tetrahydrodipicolinate reductase